MLQPLFGKETTVIRHCLTGMSQDFTQAAQLVFLQLREVKPLIEIKAPLETQDLKRTGEILKAKVDSHV